MYCCTPKGTSLWWKKGTVINHHWCSLSFLLGPASCHHNFNSFLASSSFPLYSIFTWKLIFFSSPHLPMGHAFPTSFPSCLVSASFILSLNRAVQLLCCLISGPLVKDHSPFFPLHQSLLTTALILPAPQIHSSSPIIFCTAEREKCLWEECEKRPRSFFLSGSCLGRWGGSCKVHLLEYQSNPPSSGVTPEDLSPEGPRVLVSLVLHGEAQGEIVPPAPVYMWQWSDAQ